MPIYEIQPEERSPTLAKRLVWPESEADTVAELEAFAKARNVSVSAVIREAVAEYLKQHG